VDDAASGSRGVGEDVLQKEGEDPEVLRWGSGYDPGGNDSEGEIGKIERKDAQDASKKEVAIAILRVAGVDDDGGQQSAGEYKEEGRAKAVAGLESDEMKEDR